VYDKILNKIGNVKYNVTLMRVRATIVAGMSNKYYVFRVCVCSPNYSTLQAHVPFCIVISDPCSAIIFFTLSHKRKDFRIKVIEYKMCVLNFATNLSEEFLILRRIQRDTITNVHTSSCKVTVILVRFL
jgi:hypothetical protein